MFFYDKVLTKAAKFALVLLTKFLWNTPFACPLSSFELTAFKANFASSKFFSCTAVSTLLIAVLTDDLYDALRILLFSFVKLRLICCLIFAISFTSKFNTTYSTKNRLKNQDKDKLIFKGSVFMKKKIVIIGGGAAGIMCALTLSKQNKT